MNCTNQNVKNMKQINTAYLTCPIRNVIDRFEDKWSLLVLYHIHKTEPFDLARYTKK